MSRVVTMFFFIFIFLFSSLEKLEMWGLVSILSFSLMFIFNQHIVMILIQMETLTLVLLFLMMSKLLALDSSYKPLYLVISLSVVEAALGLSFLVKFSRNFSKEFLKFLL